jgi:sirohydrochlorin cobaltochelatase
MPDSIERCLERALTGSSRFVFGQIQIHNANGGFVLSHRDDQDRNDLQVFRIPEDAIEIARYDDAGNYRPLKTAPNLRHGWRVDVADLAGLRRVLDYFYPGRLAVFAAWRENRLSVAQLRQTLNRQSGMYRVAANISDDQINDVVGDFCRSNTGCLRTILWKRDEPGTIASAKLPPEKFDPEFDQTKALDVRRPATAAAGAAIPLLCQEACNLLVAQCRKVVLAGRDVSPKRP